MLNNYALLIGVGEFKKPTELPLPVIVKDLLELKSVLTNPSLCGYLDNEQHLRLLCNETATKDSILNGLDWLKEQAEKDSDATVFIYYSGHGRKANTKYYLVPHDDLNLLPAKDFNEKIQQIPAKRLLVVLDCCHAEGVAIAKNGLRSEPFPVENLVQELNTQLNEGEGRAVFSSSEKNQLSWIRRDRKMSIYTYHFIEALKGKGNQPTDTAVRVADLIKYVDKTVKESARTIDKIQTPYFWFIGQNFPVALLSRDESPDNHSADFYYIEPPILKFCCQEISQPGCLLRIKAPLQMGKTSLISKIANYSNHYYQTAFLRLRRVNKDDIESLEAFLKWCCSSISRQLDLPSSEFDNGWDEDLASKVACQTYFEDYLLQMDKPPLVLFIDDVDKIFPYDNIAGDFLGLLRTFHEESKVSRKWKQFRQVIVYTETYDKLKITESPFNVGTEIKPRELELTQEQVQELSQKYELNLTIRDIEELMSMVGGHPYLIRTVFEQLKITGSTLGELLQQSTMPEGVYYQHLQQYRNKLQKHQDLAALFKKIIIADQLVRLNSEENLENLEKLNNLGLIKFDHNNNIAPRHELYRKYFRQYFLDDLAGG